MSHALVFWIGENKYSVVPVKKVNFDTETFKATNLIVGHTLPVKWKKQWYNAEIKAVGAKVDMEEQESAWEVHASQASFEIQEVTAAGGGEYLHDPATDQGDVESHHQDENQEAADLDPEGNTGSAVMDVMDETQLGWALKRIQDLEEEVKKKDLDIAKEKAKNKTLKRLVKKSAKHDTSAEVVNIGGDITIPKSVDDFVKASYRNNASLFFRKLISEGGVLSTEELASCSMTGKKTNHSPVEGARPPLDQHKFKILKEYTITSCSLQPNTLEMLQFDHRLRNICTDARKKLRSVKAP